MYMCQIYMYLYHTRSLLTVLKISLPLKINAFILWIPKYYYHLCMVFTRVVDISE